MSAIKTITNFRNSLGVNVHIPYTDGRYANLSEIIASMNYLGINISRVGLSNGELGSASLSSFITVAKAGIKFIIVVDNGFVNSPASLATYLGWANQIETAVPGAVIAFEGPNEINNFPVSWTAAGSTTALTGFAAATAIQEALYAAVKADAVLGNIPVIYMTGYPSATAPDPVLAGGLADAYNQHPYPNPGLPPNTYMAQSHALPKTWAITTSPTYYTETGYSSNSQSDMVQAKYGLDLFMDGAVNGVVTTCVYELFDAYKPGSPQGDDGWGFFDYNGYAKPFAYALHNMTSILTDTVGTSPVYNTIPVSITGLPATGNYLQLQKSDGTNSFVLWAEPSIKNTTTLMDVDAPAVAVVLTFPMYFSSISVYDPLSGLAPIATYFRTSSITVYVSDHPVIVVPGPQAPVQNGLWLENAWDSEIVISVPVTLNPTAKQDAAVAISVAATSTSAAYSSPTIESPIGSASVTKTLTCTVKPNAGYQIHGHNVVFGALSITTS